MRFHERGLSYFPRNFLYWVRANQRIRFAAYIGCATGAISESMVLLKWSMRCAMLSRQGRAWQSAGGKARDCRFLREAKCARAGAQALDSRIDRTRSRCEQRPDPRFRQ